MTPPVGPWGHARPHGRRLAGGRELPNGRRSGCSRAPNSYDRLDSPEWMDMTSE